MSTAQRTGRDNPWHLTRRSSKEIIEEYATHPGDNRIPEVQVAPF